MIPCDIRIHKFHPSVEENAVVNETNSFVAYLDIYGNPALKLSYPVITELSNWPCYSRNSGKDESHLVSYGISSNAEFMEVRYSTFCNSEGQIVCELFVDLITFQSQNLYVGNLSFSE